MTAMTNKKAVQSSARNRFVATFAVGLGLVGALAFGVAPASAWSSSSTAQSPSGCSGGFSGSSYKPTSTTAYASVSNYGSTCSGSRPGGQAAIRYSSNTAVAICLTTQTKHSCSATVALKSGAAGGVHVWGAKQITT